jgi:hypothetical protein
MVISILIPILSFFLQAYPRFFKKSFGVDVWTRLLEIDFIRKNNHTIPQEKLQSQFIIDGYFDYPPIFPWMLSFFSKETLKNIEGYIAPFFDSLQVLFIYPIVMILTGNSLLAVVAQGIYALTPMIAIENSYLTPRSFGYLNFSLVTISLLGYYYYGDISLLLASLVFGTAIFLTHRFATQSFLFITIFFTYYLNTALFLQIFLAGFAMAVILTNGYYLRVLKGHIANIYFWVLNKDYRFAHQVRGLVKEKKQQDWVGQIYMLLQLLSPIALFGLNPWAFSAFIVLGLHYFGWLLIPPILLTFAAWIIFFYVFGAVVLKSKYLIPIGEGQRYMEMATIPSAILSSYLFFRLPEVIPGLWVWIGFGCLIFYCLASILFIQIKGVIVDKNRSVDDNLRKVFDFINKQKKKMRIICIPHQNTTLLIYHTEADVLVNADNPGLLKLTDVYPVLRSSLPDLKRKYKLTHALVRTNFVTLKELRINKSQVLFSADDIKVVTL